jgi:signal transduction histidine kinase
MVSDKMHDGAGLLQVETAMNAAERVGDAREVPFDRLAHEIRTPLAAIQAMAEALAGGHLGPIQNARHADYVASMAETARHALAVVETMLPQRRATMESVAALPGSTGVADIAREVVLAMSLLASRSGVRLEVGSGGDDVRAVVRATDLRQMLINLVSNGIGHAGGGATVTLTAGRDGNEAWIEVADNGTGIAPALLERIVNRTLVDENFANSPMRVPLGLRLTRGLAEANGGRLRLESDTNGTRARIVLPAA